MGIRYKPELEATKTPSLIEIAWAAGVYEGEGCCQQTKNSANIRVVQKDPELLYKLRDWFGGRIITMKAKHKTPENYCSAWLACGDRARLAIALFYPFCTSRRKAQIDAAGLLRFLGGVSPDGLTMDELRTHLGSGLAYASWSDPDVKAKKKIQKAANYRERRKDPAFVENCRAQSSAGNARMRLERLTATQPGMVN